ncbi:MAG: hypothetical protein IKG67_15145, partial [Parasporobacterium sp.]|nr:hypothetical protein [Parasporobacterium sp.]
TLEQLQSDALGHDWVIDTTQGYNGWEWAADGSSATVYLQCQREGCGEPATATDAAPQAGDVSYNPATGKAEVSYAASVTKDGQTFTAETILSREITAYYYTVSFFDGEGSPIGDAYALQDNSGSDDPVAYLIDRYARPDSETINCHYGFSGWSDPIFQGYEVSMSQQKIHVFEKYSTTAQYLDALLTHVGEVPASCTQYGTEEYWTCETCGRKYSDDKGINEIDTPAVIGKLGHDLVSHVAQAPTCTAVGWDAYDTCSRCDYTTYVEKAALGHTEVIDPAVAATCTKEGLTEGRHCSVCNMVLLEQKTVEALGHDWGEWQVTKSPQIGTAGERQRTCSRCGETETEPVAALIGYSMTGAADGSWTKGSTKGVMITVKRSEDDENCFSHYLETLMDGTPADVSAEAGSTVVTFSAATLEKLTTGTHTVTIKFDDGEAEGKLTINEAESPTTPQPTQPKGPQVPATGDTSNAGLWIALLIGSLLAMLMAICAGRITREKNN